MLLQHCTELRKSVWSFGGWKTNPDREIKSTRVGKEKGGKKVGGERRKAINVSSLLHKDAMVLSSSDDATFHDMKLVQ